MGKLSRLTPHAHTVDAFSRAMAQNATIIQILPQIGTALTICARASGGLSRWPGARLPG
jgi:hypothetical protein